MASEERSQHRNRKLALARLAGKLQDLEAEKRGAEKKKRWMAHHDLERGNPVRTYRME
jgi:peptide chain release factor